MKIEKEKIIFEDQIIINGKKILEIPLENIFYQEKKLEYQTNWSDLIPKKKLLSKNIKLTTEGVNSNDIIFDPLKAIGYSQDKLLSIQSKQYIKSLKKKNRGWGKKWEKNFNPPPLNNIAQTLSQEEIEYFLRLHRLDDLNRKEKDNILEIPDPDIRSPSPEPIYNKEGQRINTLNNRVRNKMKLEKNNLIEDCQKMDVGFMTPYDYKEMKRTRKIYLPEYENTDLSYVPIILGPGGRTQQLMEELSNCRISIRGDISSDNRKNYKFKNEKTHVLVQAENDQDLEKGVEIIQRVLKGDSLQTIANSQNKFLKTGYELMAVETILRDFCENCKEEGHKLWSCPYMIKKKNKKKGLGKYLNDLIQCELCKSKTHISRDCPKQKYNEEREDMDIHYQYFKFLKDVKIGDNKLIDLKEGIQDKGFTNFITDYAENEQKNVVRKQIKKD